MCLAFVWLLPIDGAGWRTELVVFSLAELLPVWCGGGGRGVLVGVGTGVMVGVGWARMTDPSCCWRSGWVGVATGSLASGVAVPNDGRSMIAFSRPVLAVLGRPLEVFDPVFGFTSLVGWSS